MIEMSIQGLQLYLSLELNIDITIQIIVQLKLLRYGCIPQQDWNPWPDYSYKLLAF